MAENTEAKSTREKKLNFTATESNLISELVTTHLDLLKGKHSQEVTNAKKQEMWKEITSQVNALWVCLRTETEVRNRWRNLSRSAKQKFTAVQKERTQTGGGPPPAQPSQAEEENIINCMRDTASFRGVPGGQETAIVESEDQSEDTFQYNADEEMEAIWRRRLDIHFEGIDSPVPAAHVILPATQTSTPVATVIQQDQNRSDMNARYNLNSKCTDI